MMLCCVLPLACCMRACEQVGGNDKSAAAPSLICRRTLWRPSLCSDDHTTPERQLYAQRSNATLYHESIPPQRHF